VQFDEQGFCEDCGRSQTGLEAITVTEVAANMASASHRGRHHAENQDAVGLVQVAIDRYALAVADGVSTSYCARQAADLAVHTALDALQTHTVSVSPASIADRLRSAILAAHAAIVQLDMPASDADLDEPQTTCVVAQVEGTELHFGWVGDSRLYLLRACTASPPPSYAVQLLTEDDSWLNAQMRAGISVNDALKDRNAHCITQSLGMRDDLPCVHIGQVDLAPECWVLLCTDGLWNYVPDAQDFVTLLALTQADLTLSERCMRLVDFANQQGGHDNISVALLHYTSSILQ